MLEQTLETVATEPQTCFFLQIFSLFKTILQSLRNKNSR